MSIVVLSSIAMIRWLLDQVSPSGQRVCRYHDRDHWNRIFEFLDSFGLIFWPQSGILAAYSGATAQLENALGLYLFTWVRFFLLLWSPWACGQSNADMIFSAFTSLSSLSVWFDERCWGWEMAKMIDPWTLSIVYSSGGFSSIIGGTRGPLLLPRPYLPHPGRESSGLLFWASEYNFSSCSRRRGFSDHGRDLSGR